MSETNEPRTQPFTYGHADFAALARVARPPILGWLFTLVWVLVALAAALIALAAYLGSPTHPGWIAVLAVLAVLGFILQRFGPEIAASMQRAVARRHGFLRDQQMTVAPGVFRVESARGLTELKWSAVPRVVVADERLFVFVTRGTAYIVPRRAFASDAEFHAFAAAAEERWKAHHRL